MKNNFRFIKPSIEKLNVQDSLNLQERLGFYCGDINFEDKMGHLVVEYFNYNSKTDKYEFTWKVISKEDRNKSLWEDVGEINPEYIIGNSFDKITKNINENVKEQVEDGTKLAILNNQDSLIKIIEDYQDVYFQEEDNGILNIPSEEAIKKKEGILFNIQNDYKSLLNNLKKLGANVSEYPKDLEDLVK
jgi:hypothetical protein